LLIDITRVTLEENCHNNESEIKALNVVKYIYHTHFSDLIVRKLAWQRHAIKQGIYWHRNICFRLWRVMNSYLKNQFNVKKKAFAIELDFKNKKPTRRRLFPSRMKTRPFLN